MNCLRNIIQVYDYKRYQQLPSHYMITYKSNWEGAIETHSKEESEMAENNGAYNPLR